MFVVIRGDLEINEVKLINALGGGTLRPATDDEIRAVGAVPGYASPMGIGPGITVIADRSVQVGANFVAGANEEGYHLTGVNVPRDFDPAHGRGYRGSVRRRDLRALRRRDICTSSGRLNWATASNWARATAMRWASVYQDESGDHAPGGDGQLRDRVGAADGGDHRTHHDEYGIIWPRSVAPFMVHIVIAGQRGA